MGVNDAFGLEDFDRYLDKNLISEEAELRAAILEAHRNGMSFRGIARAAGISERGSPSASSCSSAD
jgi:hypothetical protein